MAQPKKPPLSVRLPPALLEHIKAEAKAKGLPVNAELVAVLARAYRLGEKAADMGATPEQLMKVVKPSTKGAGILSGMNIQVGPIERKPGSMLKGAKK